jgi:hypothetical protein
LLLFVALTRDHEAVHHGFNGVLFVTVQSDLIIQAVHLSVYTSAGEPCLADLLENSLIGPFAGAHEW